MSNMIEYMDTLVGKFSDVNELGIKDNTCVFFIGDNGLQVTIETAPFTRIPAMGSGREQAHPSYPQRQCRWGKG